MMKICSKCGDEKSTEEFYKNKRTPDGFQVYCKVCSTAEARKSVNPEAQKLRAKKYQEKNAEKIREQVKEWQAKNPERVKEATKRYRAKVKKAMAFYKEHCND